MNMKKIKEYIDRQPWLIPVLVGFVLRLYKLTFSSIWHDEGYTMWLLRYDFSGIIARTARDVHPPAYYLISKIWVSILGNSVFSIRFLSLLFSVGIIFFTYKLVELIFNKKIALWSSLLVALSPFMVRFGQEARMYGVVAFFTTLAAYFFVKAYKEKAKANLYLVLFTLSMSIAMYTQYYAFFVIISLWVIYAILTPELWQFHWIKAIKEAKGVFSWKWWLANLTLLVLYMPWFPVAYKQVTRVSGSYWIRPEWITARTIPNNVLQFIVYNHLDGLFAQGKLGQIIYWLIVVFLIGIGLIFIRKENYKKLLSLFVFGYLPMVLVFTLSKLRTPVYQDRYFPFSAIALFVIWGLAIALIKNNALRAIFGLSATLLFLFGNYVMHQDVNHHMKELSDTVKQNEATGDVVLSGELYTFLDGSYYFGDGNLRLISDPVDGYGESSLFYDQQDKYVVNWAHAQSLGNRIWVIGKTGDKEYYNPSKWLGWVPHTYLEENKDNGLKAVLYTR